MGQQKSTTRFRVENSTNFDIINTEVYSLDNHDWASDARPDHNFQHITIKSGESYEQIEELNGTATNCPFNMKIYYRDGSIDEFRLHMKYAVDNRTDPGFQKYREDHLIELERSGNNTLIIRVKHTEEQIDTMHGNNIKNQVQSFIRRRMYKEALDKIAEGLETIRNSEIRDILINMKLETQDLVTNLHLNNRAKNLLGLGQRLVDQKRYDEAIIKLYDASSLATVPETKKNIADLRAKIKSLQGEEVFQQALDAEKSELYDEVNAKLLKAKNLFEEANATSPKWEYRQQFANISNKIQGDELFNKAKNFVTVAFDLYQNNMFQKSKEKYMIALDEFKKAKEKYSITDMFERDIQRVNNSITDIEKILIDIEKKI